MKISKVVCALLFSLSSVSYAATQGCNVNSGCSFRVPINTLVTVDANSIEKNYHYKCSIEGLGKLENVDYGSAEKIGLENVTFKKVNIYRIEFSFDSKNQKVSSGDLLFNLVCPRGDMPCNEKISCSK